MCDTTVVALNSTRFRLWENDVVLGNKELCSQQAKMTMYNVMHMIVVVRTKHVPYYSVPIVRIE